MPLTTDTSAPRNSAGPGPGMPPEPKDSQLVATIDDLIARLREHAGRPDAVLTCDDLLQLVGTKAHVLAILLFSLLNLLPAPPGYNFFMALIIIVLSAFMLFGREMRLGKRFGQMKLPVSIVLKLLDLLARMAGWAAKISSPRWSGLVGPRAMPIFALIAIVFGIAMLVPIPATNMLPSIGLAMMCIGALNRDGLLALAGVVVGIVGVVIIVIATWFLFVLGFALGDVVEDGLEDLTGH